MTLGDFPKSQTKQEIISFFTNFANFFAKLWRDNYPLSLHTGSVGECVTVALHVNTGFQMSAVEFVVLDCRLIWRPRRSPVGLSNVIHTHLSQET